MHEEKTSIKPNQFAIEILAITISLGLLTTAVQARGGNYGVPLRKTNCESTTSLGQFLDKITNRCYGHFGKISDHPKPLTSAPAPQQPTEKDR